MNDDAGIYAREWPAVDRHVQVGIAQSRVLSVDFPHEPDPDAGADHDLLDRIERYLQGGEETFEDVTVALTVPADQRRTLEQVRKVPYGETTDVERLVRMVAGLDPEEDRRVVRDALAGNPAPILIPDHRVRDGPSGAPGDVTSRLRAIEGI